MNGRRVDERAAQVAQAVQKIHQQMESGELSADRGEELLGRLGQRRETVLEKSKEKLSNMLKSGAVSQEKAKELFKRMKELDEENEAVGKGGRGKSTGYGTNRKMMPDSILAKQKQTIKEKVVQGLIPKERGEKMLKLVSRGGMGSPDLSGQASRVPVNGVLTSTCCVGTVSA
eukprot:scaffold4437_cov391-Prasinococcus_capsulatus_cf.AAC.7